MSASHNTTEQSPGELLAQAVLCEEGGRYAEGLRLAQQAVNRTKGVDESLHARAQECLALLQSDLGDSETAARVIHQAYAYWLCRDDAAGQASALCVLARIYPRLGLLREGCDFAIKALNLARLIEHGGLQVRALRQISWYHIQVSEFDEAQRLLNQCLALALAQNDTDGTFWTLNNLSHILNLLASRCASRGDKQGSIALVAQVLPMVEQSIALAKNSGNQLHLAFALSNQADIYIIRGDELRARCLIAEYAELARQIGFRRLLAYARLDEVRLLVARGRHREAVQVLSTSAHQQLISEQADLFLATEHALYCACKADGDFRAALIHLEAHAAREREHLVVRSEAQARVLLARMDLEQAQAATQRAQLEVQVQQIRANALELERDALAHKALEDSLTHIGNRRAADQRLNLVMAQPFGERNRLVIALADADHFKAINDAHGHAVGDLVLVEMAQLMKESLRLHDAVFRYGGEEFLLVLSQATEAAGLEVCSRVRARVESFNWRSIAPDLSVTVSLGMASRRASDTLTSLMERADGALYGAKDAGRNRIVRG